MKVKQIDRAPKTFVLVFRTGDELAAGLSQFAREQELAAASFKAIGGLSSVRLAWFSWETKNYEPSVVLDEQLELLSLIGDVALKEGEPAVHAHVIVGKKDGTAHGGHLLEARVRPTCEVVLTESRRRSKKSSTPNPAWRFCARNRGLAARLSHNLPDSGNHCGRLLKLNVVTGMGHHDVGARG
jgi:predicted DNA-binding protein with PD1-like motif